MKLVKKTMLDTRALQTVLLEKTALQAWLKSSVRNLHDVCYDYRQLEKWHLRGVFISYNKLVILYEVIEF